MLSYAVRTRQGSVCAYRVDGNYRVRVTVGGRRFPRKPLRLRDTHKRNAPLCVPRRWCRLPYKRRVTPPHFFAPLLSNLSLSNFLSLREGL